MQWIQGLLISGTPVSFWRQLHIQQQDGNARQQSFSCHHCRHQQQQQQQQQGPALDPTVGLPTDPMDVQQQAASHSHQQLAASSESVKRTQPASLLPPAMSAPTHPSIGATRQLAASSESVECASPVAVPHNCSKDSDPGSSVQEPPPSRPRHWMGLNPLLHTHALQGYRSSPQHSRAETASAGRSTVMHSQLGPSLEPMQQPCVQPQASNSLPTGLSCTDDEPVMLGMPRHALSRTGMPQQMFNRQADATTDAQTTGQGVADLQRGANAQGGSDAWGADGQGGADVQGAEDVQGGAQGGADSMYGYLKQLPQELVACHRILQYSFVLEYYMQGSPNQTR